MLFRLKEYIRNLIIRLFMAGKNDLSSMVEEHFSADGVKSEYIVNSSIITKYGTDAQISFFRECRAHCGMRQYLARAIDDYFENVCRAPERAQLRSMAITDLEQRSNYKKMVRITEAFNSHLLEILSGEFRGYSEVGLPSFASVGDNGDFISFIKYMCCIVISHKTNRHTRRGLCENGSANKQLATYRLAKCLGVESLIPSVRVCRLTDGGNERVGTMMDKAPGVPPSDIEPAARRNAYYPTLLRDLTNLEYFDALCYQLDHRLDNYHVVADADGVIRNAVAFDNDASRTFFVSGRVPRSTYAGAGSVIAKDGRMNRPYMDKAFADRILSVSKKEIAECVGQFMSGMQMRCLWSRVKRMKRAIARSSFENGDFLVSDWQAVDVNKAVDEAYGCTYFNLYLNDTVMLDRKQMFDAAKGAAPLNEE